MAAIKKLLWRRYCGGIGAVLVVAAVLLLTQERTYSAPRGQMGFHMVESADTWAGIAARYGIPLGDLWQANGVTNPVRLSVGQRLFIPGAGHQQNVIATEAAILTPWLAAMRSGNTLSTVLAINGLGSAAEASGIALYAPDRQPMVAQIVSAPSTRPTSAPPTPQPARTPVPGPPLIRSRLGIQGYFAIPDVMDQWLAKVTAMGFTWVKYQVDWRQLENPPDAYPTLSTLDAFMDDVQGRRLNVLLSIVKAPDWARNTTEGSGPPTDQRTLTDFARFLAGRYKNRLDTMQIAFEIWNEPNTFREWVGAPLSARDYVSLLAGAYVAIKAEDTRYTVISAGLAPTGISDGTTSIDDRLYLRQMFDADLARVSDGIGVHPYGWSNPPSTRCCGDPNTPPGYDEHHSFFFLDTVEDYRAMQVEYGDGTDKLWVTEFGWGTVEGFGGAVPPGAPYFTDITAQLQAEYVWQAYLMAQQWEYMGPMFLWNLNMVTVPSVDAEAAAYSIFYSIDNPRPAYELLRDAPKADAP